MKNIFIYALAALSILACARTSSKASLFSNSSTYYSTMSELKVAIYYEPQAVPYTGKTTGGLDIFSVLSTNIEALFNGRNIQFTVPNTLNGMKELPSQNKTVWTHNDIEKLARNSQPGVSTPNTSYFSIYFLKGYYESEGTQQTSTIGLNITGTPFIAIFKDVILSKTSDPNGLLAKFMEQTTLVHEMGHALGLVNSGIPMATQHQDTAHGSHCTNPNCVMYWLNEGQSDLSAFILKYLQSASLVMFGQECLNDAANYNP